MVKDTDPIVVTYKYYLNDRRRSRRHPFPERESFVCLNLRLSVHRDIGDYSTKHERSDSVHLRSRVSIMQIGSGLTCVGPRLDRKFPVLRKDTSFYLRRRPLKLVAKV